MEQNINKFRHIVTYRFIIFSAVLAVSYLSGCTGTVPIVKYKTGSNSTVEQRISSIGSKEEAAQILQKAINSSRLMYVYGDLLIHKGFLGPDASPPDPEPPSPTLIAVVNTQEISTSWDEYKLVKMLSAKPGVVTYRKESFQRHIVRIPFDSIQEIYFAKVMISTWVDRKVLDRDINRGDGVWIFLSDKNFGQSSMRAPTRLSDFRMALYVEYKDFKGGLPPGYASVYRRWSDKNQPNYRKLNTILASLKVLCDLGKKSKQLNL